MKKKVSIVGLGYVGLPLGLLASKKGYDVTGIDINENHVKKINQRKDPINDEYIEANIKNTALKAATNYDSVSKSDIVIICVPTPVDAFHPDLGPLMSSSTSVAHKLSKGTLVIVESTINPGMCDDVVIPLIEKESGLKVNKDFYVSHCPERINPGDTQWSVENIPRVVGSSNEKGLKLSVDFYRSIIGATIKPMGSLKEAESVKIVENCFRDVNIAFVNELAKSFTKLGINVKNVIEGAATKPFAFMPHFPSVGVGGHCIPVDPYYLIEYARGYGFEHEFMALARTINNSMPEFTVEQLREALNDIRMPLKDTKVTVLGLSYKPNVADDRESPSYKLIKILQDKGAKVKAFDPYLPTKSTDKNLSSALKGADAVVLATNHKEFMDVDFSKFAIKVLVDGKNALDRNSKNLKKIVYKGIGT